jgi:hypothetical protein
MVNITLGASVSNGAPPAKGFYRDPINAQGVITANAYYPVAIGTHNTAPVNERPAWFNFWAKLYDFYTVLGCEYKIIIHNPTDQYSSQIITGPATTKYATTAAADNVGALLLAPAVSVPTKLPTNIVVAEQFDTYSDTATSTGNVMPLTQYEEIRQYKNIRWHQVKDGGNTTVITGTYKPGQAKRNITNDGDVKTWTATTTTLPSLKEILTLNFFQDPLNITSNAAGVNNVGCNMEINLKYIIQFKDLKQQARYPNTITTDQDIVLTLNETNTNEAYMKWGA